MATTRSAARPLTRHAPSSSRRTRSPLPGPSTTKGSARARRAGLVDERAEPPEELVEPVVRHRRDALPVELDSGATSALVPTTGGPVDSSGS